MECLKQPRTINRALFNMEGNVTAENDAINKHDRYLITLQKHKKYLKGLNTKTKAEEEQEKREKAFSPYVNGANALQPCVSPRKKPEKLRPHMQSRVSLTTRQEDRTQKTVELTPRPKSAFQLPGYSQSNRQRRFWGQGSVQIKDADGNTVRAARENLNHSYADDFEDYESSDSDVEDLNVLITGETDEEDENIPEELSTRKCWKDTPRINSSDIVYQGLVETTDSLNIDNIPVLGKKHTFDQL